MENTKKVIITPVVQTITVGYRKDPVYTFDELPESVQRQLIDDEVKLRQEESVDYFPWFDEDFDSLKTTAEILNIKTKWEADKYGASIYIVAENNNEYVDMCDITGLRACKYIVNNFLPDFRRGKYYSLAYNKEKHCYPYRHSKCQFNYDGDGYYLDLIFNEVWQGMKRSIIKKNSSVMDFIQAVVDEYADEISQDITHFFSREGVQEDLSSRGDYWTKDGEPVDDNDVKEVATDV
jgi:hypothetical protein